MFVKVINPVFSDSGNFHYYQTEMHECKSALWREASDSWKQQSFDWELFLLPQRSKLHFTENEEGCEFRTSIYYLNNEGKTIDTIMS